MAAISEILTELPAQLSTDAQKLLEGLAQITTTVRFALDDDLAERPAHYRAALMQTNRLRQDFDFAEKNEYFNPILLPSILNRWASILRRELSILDQES